MELVLALNEQHTGHFQPERKMNEKAKFSGTNSVRETKIPAKYEIQSHQTSHRTI